MILPTEEARRSRRCGYQRRGVVTGIAVLAMLLSAVLRTSGSEPSTRTVAA